MAKNLMISLSKMGERDRELLRRIINRYNRHLVVEEIYNLQVIDRDLAIEALTARVRRLGEPGITQSFLEGKGVPLGTAMARTKNLLMIIEGDP